jgi:hypothetical protein
MEVVKQHPPLIEGFRISRLQYLIHLIMSHKQKKYPGSWSVLNMQILLQQIHQQGIIERKNYSAGRNSTLYRIKEEGKAEFRILADWDLIERINESLQKLKLRNSKKHPDLNLTARKVCIEHVVAFDFLEKELQDNLAGLKAARDNLTLEQYKKKYKKLIGRYNFGIGEVEKIRSGELYIKVNTTNYRYDTNFTHLPSELFAFLRIDGYPLVELDITNSQPFFAATLFDMRQDVERVMRKYLGDSLTMYTKSLKLSVCEDVRLYTSLVCSGKFYDYMGKLFMDNGIIFETRKELKDLIFGSFFDKAHAYHYKKEVALFRKAFPNVYRLFYLIKKKEYNRLAILLQRIESHIMLDLVVPRIKNEFPELDLLTKHDSIQPFKHRLYSPDGGSTTFKIGKIMLDVIEDATGLRPSGKAKRYVDIPETSRISTAENE